MLLAIGGFSLSLLGTFLVRSGVLVSVHAFATDPARGVFILAFLAVVIGGALALFAWRAPTVTGGGSFDYLSRETLLLINNVLLVVAAGAILLGTLYPLLVDALGLGKISVGPPYFNLVFVPLMLVLCIFIGLGPAARWKRDSAGALLARRRVAMGASVILALLLGLLLGGATLALMCALLAGSWVLATTVQGVVSRIRHRRDGWRAIRRLPAGFVGMTLAHLGVAVFIFGVTVTSVFDQGLDVRLAPGERVDLGDYSFEFRGVSSVAGPNYQAERGSVMVRDGGTLIAELHPEKRLYAAQAQPMTEAAIDAALSRDIYVALGESVDENTWTLRLQIKPMIRCIWLGALLMAVGGLIAACDRRYRSLVSRPGAAARIAPDGLSESVRA